MKKVNLNGKQTCIAGTSQYLQDSRNFYRPFPEWYAGPEAKRSRITPVGGYVLDMRGSDPRSQLFCHLHWILEHPQIVSRI
jgi:hypothetical protein